MANRQMRTPTSKGIEPVWAALLGGVYAITAPSGEQYIGGTKNFANRWKVHRSGLRRGLHYSAALQAAWNASGPETFRLRVLFICRPEDVLFYEQKALDELKPAFNTAVVAEFSQARRGIGHTTEARAKMSASQKGQHTEPKSEAHKVALSAALFGRIVPAEIRAKMSASKVGKKRAPFSDAHRAAIAAGRLGTKASDETKAKLSAMRAGKKRSAAHGAAISAALKGKPHSPERRLSQSLARRRYLDSIKTERKE